MSKWPDKQGARLEYTYKLSALTDDAALSPLGRVVSTRTASVPGKDKARRLVVEFDGGELASLRPEQPVEAQVTLSSGKLVRSHVEALPWQKSWRVFIDF